MSSVDPTLLASNFTELPTEWQDFLEKNHPDLVQEITTAQALSHVEKINQLNERIEELEGAVDLLNDVIDQRNAELHDAVVKLRNTEDALRRERHKKLPLKIRWI